MTWGWFGLVETIGLILLAWIGWLIQDSIKRNSRLEEKLRDERVELYEKVLEPFVILFIPDRGWKLLKGSKNKNKGDEAIKKMMSFEYRNLIFKLSMIGSDQVFRAYTNLMQYIYQTYEKSNSPSSMSGDDNEKILKLLGVFLLSIRKDLGKTKTEFTELGMLEWFITDFSKLDQYKKQNKPK